MMWNGLGWGVSGVGWVVMGVSMLLFWGLIIAGIVALIRVINRPSSPPSAPTTPPWQGEVSSARRILDERYARGEIDEQEYQRRRAQLEGGASR
jgi:putative membrane protein